MAYAIFSPSRRTMAMHGHVHMLAGVPRNLMDAGHRAVGCADVVVRWTQRGQLDAERLLVLAQRFGMLAHRKKHATHVADGQRAR